MKNKNSSNSNIMTNPHFWVILLLLAIAVVLHYPQQILSISTPSLFSFLGLTRHAIERVFLLLPVCYAGFIFGLNWGLVSLLIATIIMIPRIFLVSEYFPDALLESITVLLVGFLVNIWIDSSKKERLRRQIILSELDVTQQQLRDSSADLAVSESKYQDLFENAHDAIWEQDLEGNITNVNQAFEVLSGSVRYELLNMNVKSFMDEHSLNLAAQIKRSLYSQEQIEQPYEQRLTRKDGTVAILQMATSLVRENGTPAGYLHIAREVTRKEQLNALLSIMEEGIAVIGKDRKIQFMNPSLIKEFGNSTGQYCYRLFHGKDGVCDNCRFDPAIHGMTEKREWTAQDGNIFEIIYTPFTNFDQTPGILATFVDVTKRKKIERELVRLNDLKSEWLDQKIEQLREISREVAKLEDEKKQFVRFLGIVAHDLKSPLSVSQTIIDSITEGYYGPIAEEQRDMLNRVARRIDGLNDLINDLVDIPLIETGQLVKEMTDISPGEIIQSSVEEFTQIASEKGLQLTTSLPSDLPNVFGSKRHLRQVMTNLISNAVKYSERGFVLVQCSKNEDHLTIEVSDHGIGIPKEDLPKLFVDFFRSKNSQGIKGTGLGLSICKRIIVAHGGNIWAESPDPATNSGSKITITLPYKNSVYGGNN